MNSIPASVMSPAKLGSQTRSGTHIPRTFDAKELLQEPAVKLDLADAVAAGDAGRGSARRTVRRGARPGPRRTKVRSRSMYSGRRATSHSIRQPEVCSEIGISGNSSRRSRNGP